ncbi:hypothetical protein PFLUV_G00141170 [Perca fluviatilis]|uniref:Fibronectin type-III domain-containing protein n=1 Tax=Perca fluviatilis TaxID=8168 RepID=A0A6A5EMK3_PERFL|nr:uncharacterized protein LOC120569640 [Perca fluviatilis]XP_039673538.1 uncharacterized protein LOC120569640 [Perca fluviatilis]KAF1382200.1 hypothetical protein PFLUV_G00141170 [Perca fluviatilis]
MTALLWMLAWLPQVLTAMSEVPQPVNVTLSSKHFIHVLKWAPGPRTPTGVHYHVSVRTMWGTSLVPVAGCEHVQHPLVCNLTEAFSDPNESYFTQVKAVLDAQVSEPVIQPEYKPIRDTDMDLPLLTVTPCGPNLCVELQPPMEHLRGIYDSLRYRLRIQDTGYSGSSTDKAQFNYTRSLRRVPLEGLVSGREYCVSVCFSDDFAPRKSSYSQPVCASTPGLFTAGTDLWIAALLILLVMLVLVVVVLLVFTGFICLRRRSLPSVLDIHHIEGLVVVASCKTSLSSLLDVNPTAPSSGEKRSSQTSDQSDVESETESTGGTRGGGGYKLRRGTNLLSSSYSSPSLLSAPLCAEPEPLLPSFSSDQTPSDFFHLQPEPSVSAETHSRAGPKDSLPISEPSSDPRPAEADLLTVGKIQPEKAEEKVAGDGGSQDVNLFTLTFGTYGEEKEEDSHVDVAEVETESSSSSEVYRTIPTPPSQTTDISIATVSYSDDDEDEEEDEVDELSGYMRRP